MKWAKDNWTEERPPKIGFMIYDHSSAWDELNGAREWAPKLGLGFEFVGYEVVPFAGTLDTSTEWLRLAAKNPDWIYVGACGSTLVTLSKDAARLGIQEKGIKICNCGYGVDEIVLKPMGKSAEGWYAVRLHPSATDQEVPGVRLAHEMIKRYRGLDEACSHYIGACGISSIIIEAIRLAMEKVGYENLNGRAVRDAMMTIKDFTPFGEVFPPVTITENRPYVCPYFRMYQVREGRIWRVSDWLESAFHFPELG